MKTQDTLLNQKNRNPFKKQYLETVIKRSTKVWSLKYLKVQMVRKLLREDLGKIVDSEVRGHLQTVFKENLHQIKNQLILLHLKPLMSLLLQRQTNI
jgi:hypothetical protein